MTTTRHLRWLLFSLMICITFAASWPVEAADDVVALVCVPYRPGTFGPRAAFTVVVNYRDSTARNVFGSDSEWLPARITKSTIRWTNLIRWPGGRQVKDDWSIDRTSGVLTRENAGTAYCAQPAQHLLQTSGIVADGTELRKF